MPLYEVVLRPYDGDEIRLTDQELRVGDTFEAVGLMWVVESEEPCADGIQRRFVARRHHTDRS